MSVSHPEPHTKLTYDDYAQTPHDGKQHEIIDGQHFMNPAPSPHHQRISREIFRQLDRQIAPHNGEVFYAPIALQLSEFDIVEPDLVVILRDNDIVTETKIDGVPDLIVEILSPSNRNHDLQIKRQLYEQSGVPEYWIVDPENNVVTQLTRNQSGRFEAETRTEEITFDSVPVTVDLGLSWK